MKHILLLGAGKIGEMISAMLLQSGDYRLTVVDRDPEALKRIPSHDALETKVVDVADPEALASVLQGKYAVLSACPFSLTKIIAPQAKAAGVHYFDLTEDVQATRLTRELAQDSKTAFVPQCGLAPGFISIVAHDLSTQFESLDQLQMKVGALPKYPTNALKYNLTWSTDGLINEYLNLCEAIVDGELREVPPLEELEHLSLDGVEYEAFNTSGGLGTLCETLAGKVKNLNYRTMRYPGHRDILKLLLHDLKLGERFDVMKDIFEYALPRTEQDVVVIVVNATGQRQGQLFQKTYAHKVYAQEIGERTYSAIQITTAAGICAMLDMHVAGKIPQSGFVKQEDVSLEAFLANRFGAYYRN